MRLKELLKPAVILFLICSVTALALSGVNLLTADAIEEKQLEKAEESRLLVLPTAERFEPGFDGTCYIGFAGDEIAGYVFETEARGYGGAVRVMTGIDAESGRISGVELLEHEETPGLGANAEREDFRGQFLQEVSPNGFSLVRYQQPGEGEIEALTGASMTSRAVLNAVNEAMEMYFQILEMTGEGE